MAFPQEHENTKTRNNLKVFFFVVSCFRGFVIVRVYETRSSQGVAETLSKTNHRATEATERLGFDARRVAPSPSEKRSCASRTRIFDATRARALSAGGWGRLRRPTRRTRSAFPLRFGSGSPLLRL